MKLLNLMAPVILCAVISFQALVSSARKESFPWSQPLFYAFLPGCFLLLVSSLIHMSREISRLRRRIARLERRSGPATLATEPSEGPLAGEHPPVDSSTAET